MSAAGSAVSAFGETPRGRFLPPVAKKLTQSPWFLKVPKVCQPPSLQSDAVYVLVRRKLSTNVVVSTGAVLLFGRATKDSPRSRRTSRLSRWGRNQKTR